MVEIGERIYEDRPAPGALEQLRMLLNSDDRFHGRDRFDDPAQLHTFLVGNEILMPDEAISRTGARRLRVLRDTVRAFLAEPGPTTASALDDLARAHPLVVRLDSGGEASSLGPHEPRDTADQVIARQLSTLHQAIVDGAWTRLDICRRDDCQWVYYDSSRNRSARWCSADPCGDVMKSRAWRERQKSLAG